MLKYHKTWLQVIYPRSKSSTSKTSKTWKCNIIWRQNSPNRNENTRSKGILRNANFLLVWINFIHTPKSSKTFTEHKKCLILYGFVFQISLEAMLMFMTAYLQQAKTSSIILNMSSLLFSLYRMAEGVLHWRYEESCTEKHGWVCALAVYPN